jgi:hypothetical protein
VHRASVSQSIDVVYYNSLAAGSDYKILPLLFVTFDNDNRQRSFDVTIIDDSSIEFDEIFIFELRFNPFAFEPPSNVILSPNITTIDIVDNDDIDPLIGTVIVVDLDPVVIGFLNTPYAVNIGDGLVNIQVGFIFANGTSESVKVNFSIGQDQSDRGKSNLC